MVVRSSLPLHTLSTRKDHWMFSNPLVPTKLFLTKGIGIHKDYLQSFELALRDAGVESCNLVNVSSILPPHCEIIPREDGLKMLRPGQITFAVIARQATNEPGRLLSSSIGVALPMDRSHHGYLSEHHPFGELAQVSGDYAEDLAATMLATTLGIPFDPDTAWSEREAVYRMSGKIIKSENITSAGTGDLTGKWTTVVALAVFCDYNYSQITGIPEGNG